MQGLQTLSRFAVAATKKKTMPSKSGNFCPNMKSAVDTGHNYHNCLGSRLGLMINIDCVTSKLDGFSRGFPVQDDGVPLRGRGRGLQVLV